MKKIIIAIALLAVIAHAQIFWTISTPRRHRPRPDLLDHQHRRPRDRAVPQLLGLRRLPGAVESHGRLRLLRRG